MIFFSQYKRFKKVYPKDIQIATLIFAIQMSRKTIFNTWSGILMIPCICLSLYIIYKNRNVISKATKGTKAIMWYALFAAFSFFWAIEKDPATIFLKDLELVCSYMSIAIVLFKIKEISLAYNYVIILCTLACMLSIGRGVMAGLYFHTNSYTVPAFVGTIMSYCAWSKFHVKSAKTYLLLNCIALLIGTSSASYIAFLVALCIYFTASKHGINIGKVLGVLVVSGALYAVGSNIIKDLVFYGKSEAEIQSGTGRDFIWSVFFNAWEKQPLIGYGYSIAERSFSTFAGQDSSFTSAHNGYLSLLVNTGVIGFLLFCPIFIRTLWQGLKYGNHGRYGLLCSTMFACMIGVMVNNYAYPILGSDWNFAFPPIIALVILINTFSSKQQNIHLNRVF